MTSPSAEPAYGTPGYYAYRAEQCRLTAQTDFRRFVGSAVVTCGFMLAGAATALTEHDTKGSVTAVTFAFLAGVAGNATNDINDAYRGDLAEAAHYEAMAKIGNREA